MLRDADLMEMALAWPRLRHLVIDHELFTDTRPCRPATTLSGLLHLVRHCPDLRHVALDIDASSPNISLDTRPGGGACNAHIITLAMGSLSVIGDPIQVAAFLIDVFPNLRSLRCHSSELEDSNMWEETERFPSILAAFRMWAVQEATASMIPKAVADVSLRTIV